MCLLWDGGGGSCVEFVVLCWHVSEGGVLDSLQGGRKKKKKRRRRKRKRKRQRAVTQWGT